MAAMRKTFGSGCGRRARGGDVRGGKGFGYEEKAVGMAAERGCEFGVRGWVVVIVLRGGRSTDGGEGAFKSMRDM